MPNYEYQCEKCGHVFEETQPFEHWGHTRCPACKTTRTHRIIGDVVVQFKGPGFYSTDKKGDKKDG